MLARAPRCMIVVSIVGALMAFATPADAQRDGDGLYGRWDRPLQLSVGAGPAISWIEDETHVGLAADLRLMVANMAGVVVASRWAPDAGQYLVVGIGLRPLFPMLFLLDLSIGNEFADLFIQSLYLEVGPAFLLDGNRSVGLAVGFGLSAPLYRPLQGLQGIWLRLGVRHVNVDPSFRDTPNDVDRTEWTLFASLELRFGIKANVRRWEAPRYRLR